MDAQSSASRHRRSLGEGGSLSEGRLVAVCSAAPVANANGTPLTNRNPAMLAHLRGNIRNATRNALRVIRKVRQLY